MVEPLRHRRTRGGNRHARPSATAPHSYSTESCRPLSANSGLSRRRGDRPRLDSKWVIWSSIAQSPKFKRLERVCRFGGAGKGGGADCRFRLKKDPRRVGNG